MVCSSQNSFPHFLQLTLPFVPPNLFPHIGSAHESPYDGLCQCTLVTTSSGSTTRNGSGVECPLEGLAGSEGVSLDSNTSRPLNFWLRTARGWNFLALFICALNQSLTSSCWTSSRLAWRSSMCLGGVRCAYSIAIQSLYLFSCSNVT
jgi:hypothetical protein